MISAVLPLCLLYSSVIAGETCSEFSQSNGKFEVPQQFKDPYDPYFPKPKYASVRKCRNGEASSISQNVCVDYLNLKPLYGFTLILHDDGSLDKILPLSLASPADQRLKNSIVLILNADAAKLDSKAYNMERKPEGLGVFRLKGATSITHYFKKLVDDMEVLRKRINGHKQDLKQLPPKPHSDEIYEKLAFARTQINLRTRDLNAINDIYQIRKKAGDIRSLALKFETGKKTQVSFRGASGKVITAEEVKLAVSIANEFDLANAKEQLKILWLAKKDLEKNRNESTENFDHYEEVEDQFNDQLHKVKKKYGYDRFVQTGNVHSVVVAFRKAQGCTFSSATKTDPFVNQKSLLRAEKIK